MGVVFTVFNIGTGHTRAEQNNTIAKLYKDCTVPNKFVNDGPGTGSWAGLDAVGTLTGISLNNRCGEAVKRILAAKPRTVNLTGHSRGAVLCHMIANDLAASPDPAAKSIEQVNMVVLDPVNRSVYVHRTGELRSGIKLGKYLSVVMENETSPAFGLMTVQGMADHFQRRMEWIHMPGTHGSGTQPETSAIGLACFLILKRCLAQWGTDFTTPVPTPMELCDAFARIHLDNPVKYDRKGLVKSRKISDHDGDGKKIKESFQSAGRVNEIRNNYEQMARSGKMVQEFNFRDSPYFFNTFHLAAFREVFPAIVARMNGRFDNQSAVNAEIQRIERYHHKIAESLERLGMI